MDTLAMKYFMEIASGRTYMDVSEDHHISQSSVSKAIFRLEDELNVKLFDRSRRSVTLTPAGEILLECLGRIEPEFDEALAKMSRYALQKEVRCCVIPHEDFMSVRLRLQLSDLSKNHPEIRVLLERKEDPAAAAIDLGEGRYDFVLGHRLAIYRDDFEAYHLRDDTLYAVVPDSHPLCGRAEIDFKELYPEHFMIRSFNIREVLRECCDYALLPLPPNCTIFELMSSDLKRDQMIMRVAMGQGITLYFDSDLTPFNLDGVKAVRVSGCPDFPIVLYRKKEKALRPWQSEFMAHMAMLLTK